MSADSTYYYVVRAVRSDVESVDSNQCGPVRVSDGLARPTLTARRGHAGRLRPALVELTGCLAVGSLPAPNNVAYYEVRRMGEHESYGTRFTP